MIAAEADDVPVGDGERGKPLDDRGGARATIAVVADVNDAVVGNMTAALQAMARAATASEG